MSEHNLTLSDLDGLDIDDFDAAEYLTSEEAVAAYITEALESNDAALLAAAVGNIARARGMSQIAKAAGLTREGLYKALRPNSQPRLETITRVIGALGVRLVAQVIPPHEKERARQPGAPVKSAAHRAKSKPAVTAAKPKAAPASAKAAKRQPASSRHTPT